MFDPPGRGRAGWGVDQYNDFVAGVAGVTKPPVLGRSDSSQWLEWNTSPTFGVHGPRDPTCTGDDNRGTLHINCNGGLDAYVAAMQQISAYHKSRVIYLGHSQGGTDGSTLAAAHPELIKALISLEPQAGRPFPSTLDPKTIKTVHVLSLHGINQVGRPTTPGCLDIYDSINAARGDATFFSLLLLPNDSRFPFYSRIPRKNQINDWGTDHLMFWDKSSDAVAGVIDDWLSEHVLNDTKQGHWCDSHFKRFCY